MTGVLIKKGTLGYGDRHAHREKPLRLKTEIRGLFLQAKGQQKLPANYQKLGEKQEQILPHSPLEEPTLPTP